MTKITQTCDSCGTSRELTLVGYTLDYHDISQAAQMKGWREVKNDKHLCNDCINKAIS